MDECEIRRIYDSYVVDIAEANPRRTAFKRGILHGLGIALAYDYEAVERDITQARRPEALPGQIELAI